MNMFENKTAIITGASRGIGAAIAESLYTSGANIVVNYLQNKEEAEKLKNALEIKFETENKPKIIIYQTDVSDYSQAKQLIEKTQNEFSGLDIIVNNAGMSFTALIENLSKENWDKIINTNLTAAFNIVNPAIPYLKEQKHGKIINISSLTATQPDIGLAAYTASKAGLEGFTKALAKELARYNIQVNSVAPGYTDAGMFATLPDELKEKLIKKVPLKRFGTANEIAGVVKFLASTDADYITGQVIHVNGGTCM